MNKTYSQDRDRTVSRPNIFQQLTKDHRKVEWLLDQLVLASEEDSEEWKDLIDEIRDELIPHSRAEEELLYNELRERSATGAKRVMHSYSEHAMAEAELRTLQAARVIDANWTRLAKKLRSDILHHVDEEEGRLFDVAKRVFSRQEAQQMAEDFRRLKPMIRRESLAGTTMDLMSNLVRKRRRSDDERIRRRA